MVIKLKYGNTNTFLIKGTNGYLLIDTDYIKTLDLFYKAIKKENIQISDINYIISTHYHPDHVGIVSELMNKGIKLVVLDSQYDYVHFSDKILNFKPIDVDKAIILNIENSKEFLKSIGINGQIIKTTSHSEDSISIILDTGECFVGDLEPYEYISAYESNDKLKNDWDNIKKYNPKVIYYSHINSKIFNY